ncbi:MAG TPA: 2-octaprenyl-6-methoxyphenyl hydroxylase [Pseudomonadales bacterium]|nr:2-octaprenyl-6-methoxyphenyl hydroxylase [Pseudomonadales bacterium]
MSVSVDVAIVGGGMAGAGLALLLAQQLPDLSIALIEQHALQTANAEQLLVPSFDARATALSCSTQKILDSLGLWQHLQAYATPILQVHVSERKRPLGMLMSAEDTGLSALGYVVENRFLGNSLLEAVLSRGANIHAFSPALVERATMSAHCATLTIKAETHFQLDAKLVVVADGAQSALRQQLGIGSDNIPYDQHALVANIVTELPHGGVAYERFTETGPIALLPLRDYEKQGEKKHRAALIWTLPDRDIDQVVQCPEEQFLLQVQKKIGGRCGKLLSVGARYCYPLSLVQAREQVRSRVVLMGSAAHHLHPVAGQGFNLIMRDCQALVDSLQLATMHGSDIGDIAVLQQYVAKQRWDQQKTVTASDWLPRLFSNRHRPQMMLRSAALLGLDFLPGLREWFAREATGL